MNSRRAGFTLVELMVTVSLIAIVGLLTAPGMLAQIPKRRVDGATKALAAEMSLARMKAISSNRVHHAAFDPANQRIEIYRDDDNNWGTANVLVKTIDMASAFPNVSLDFNSVTGVDGVAVAQAATFGASAGPVRATFLPNGLLSEGGVFYLMPVQDKGNRNDRLRAVQVSRAGQVTRWRAKAGNNPPWEEY